MLPGELAFANACPSNGFLDEMAKGTLGLVWAGLEATDSPQKRREASLLSAVIV